MNNLEILAGAFEFIESNLQNEIKTQDVADACFCSKSVLEKIFRCVSNLGVHEYIVKRRMMLAARQIITDKEVGMLDVALSCGYSTNESFSRAFKSVWNCNPSEFRNKEKYSELFPKLNVPMVDRSEYINNRRNVDISELYETLIQREKCYFICCDIVAMTLINEVSYKAGDMAILETHNRMLTEAGLEDIVFRIGGDEFVMMTNSCDVTYAENVANRIKQYNGRMIEVDGREIPVSLHISITKFDTTNLKYKDVFEKLHMNIINTKNP